VPAAVVPLNDERPPTQESAVPPACTVPPLLHSRQLCTGAFATASERRLKFAPLPSTAVPARLAPPPATSSPSHETGQPKLWRPASASLPLPSSLRTSSPPPAYAAQVGVAAGSLGRDGVALSSQQEPAGAQVIAYMPPRCKWGSHCPRPSRALTSVGPTYCCRIHLCQTSNGSAGVRCGAGHRRPAATATRLARCQPFSAGRHATHSSSLPIPIHCGAQGLCAEQLCGAKEGQPHLPHPHPGVQRCGGQARGPLRWVLLLRCSTAACISSMLMCLSAALPISGCPFERRGHHLCWAGRQHLVAVAVAVAAGPACVYLLSLLLA